MRILQRPILVKLSAFNFSVSDFQSFGFLKMPPAPPVRQPDRMVPGLWNAPGRGHTYVADSYPQPHHPQNVISAFQVVSVLAFRECPSAFAEVFRRIVGVTSTEFRSGL